jgi:hypothetical protein
MKTSTNNIFKTLKSTARLSQGQVVSYSSKKIK